LGIIPAVFVFYINFCFNVEALSTRSGRLFGSTPLQTSTHIWRLLNPALRVSNLKCLLGLNSTPKILRDTQKDCGKPGCRNDYRIQNLGLREPVRQQRAFESAVNRVKAGVNYHFDGLL
jgi:hypothetical protein